jgi:hypothetical protein
MAGLPAGCLRTPGDPGPGGGRQPGIIEQAGVPAGGRTPVNLAVEPAGAVPGRRGTGGCSCPVRRPGRAITLSDMGGRGERAHYRRSGRLLAG